MKFILAILTITIVSNSYSQAECGFDYILAHPESIYIPPSLKNNNNILKQSKAPIIDNSTPKIAEISKDYPYPKLPGFEPTGDLEWDRREFARIRLEIYSESPEKYQRLSRNSNPVSTKRIPNK
tara:strand:- start:1944 stop:2315 length:372 start_codon:yes stop_codon:yes gene_type:complete